MAQQLSLPVNLPDDQTFDSFYTGNNHIVLEHLRMLSAQTHNNAIPITYLSGDSGAGKSHLLFAVCHQALAAHEQAVYLDMALLDNLSPEVLIGLEQLQWVCIDNVHQLSGIASWQEGMFDLINRCLERKSSQLVLSANCGPKSLDIGLPDLSSRLSWGTSFSLQKLADDDLQAMLIQRGKQRGMLLSGELSHFIVTRCSRHSHELMQILDKLDQQSLQQKKKLTIPFVKQVLEL